MHFETRAFNVHVSFILHIRGTANPKADRTIVLYRGDNVSEYAHLS